MRLVRINDRLLLAKVLRLFIRATHACYRVILFYSAYAYICGYGYGTDTSEQVYFCIISLFMDRYSIGIVAYGRIPCRVLLINIICVFLIN